MVRLKMKEFVSENAAPEGMRAQGGLIEHLVVINFSVQFVFDAYMVE